MRKLALFVGLFLAPAILLATDYSFRGNKIYSTMSDGTKARGLLAYTTNGSGSLVPLGSPILASDTSFRGDNLYGVLTGGNPTVPAIVLYTTDGAGTLKPIPGPDLGIVHNFGTNVPSATSAVAIAAAQTLAGAGNFTLVGGSFTAGFTGGRKVTFTSTGNISARTFTIIGTDYSGAAQTSTISGPNNNTVTDTKYYQTVTQIASDGAVGTNTSAGYAASLVVLNPTNGTHHILSPTNGENYLIACYGGTGTGYTNKMSLKINSPAGGTVTWADGTTPSDTRIYFKSGTEITPTASGTDWFDLETDATTASSDAIWYVTNFAQDLKP